MQLKLIGLICVCLAIPLVQCELDSKTDKPTPNCRLCKIIVKELFQFIRDNRTEDSIRYSLDRVCQLVFHHNPDDEQKCEQMVAAYSREIIELLTQETDPSLVCTLIDQCVFSQDKEHESVAKPLTRTPTLGEFISMLDSSIGLNSPETCIECKLFLKYLQNALSRPESQDEIKNFLLKNLCGSLEDDELKQQCTSMIQQYADTFFKALALELDPKVACVELGACKRSHRDLIDSIFQSVQRQAPSFVQSLGVKPTMSMMPTTNPDRCDLCIEAVEKADEFIGEVDIHPDFAVVGGIVCSQMSEKKQDCLDIFDTLGVQVGRGIMNMDAPRTVCSPLFCSP